MGKRLVGFGVGEGVKGQEVGTQAKSGCDLTITFLWFLSKLFSLGELNKRTPSPFFPNHPSPHSQKKKEEKNFMTGTGSFIERQF